MVTVTLEEAQSHLKELIDQKPGEELLIVDGDRTVARLLIERKPRTEPRQLGTMKGTVLYIAPDFDAIPEGFEEYLP
jgi:antitoxin (DNA-binding transcriptional repressor) of toxin-antitoxin stability system